MNPQSESFNNILDQLRSILKSYEQHLVVKTGPGGDYYLETRHLMKNKQPLFFASTKIQKNYVSFYLMPVYACPDLLDDISPELRKRMQGKSCFNFTKLDPAILEELRVLTEKGYQSFIAEL